MIPIRKTDSPVISSYGSSYYVFFTTCLFSTDGASHRRVPSSLSRPVRMGFMVDKEQISLLLSPCKYHSTNEPYLIIHLSPILCSKHRRWQRRHVEYTEKSYKSAANHTQSIHLLIDCHLSTPKYPCVNIVKSGYNDISLYENSPIASRILW